MPKYGTVSQVLLQPMVVARPIEMKCENGVSSTWGTHIPSDMCFPTREQLQVFIQINAFWKKRMKL